MKLVTDSIAQQRQLASQAIIYSPYALIPWFSVLVAFSAYWLRSTSDIPYWLTSVAAAGMVSLVAIRGWTAGYIDLAEAFTVKFLRRVGDDGEVDMSSEPDTVLVTEFGSEVIGTIILRFPEEEHGGKKKKAKGLQTVLIRAWTVRIKYRRKGVGRALVEEALHMARKRCGADVRLEVDLKHANSGRVLNPVFNDGFDVRERWARRVVREVEAQA